MLSVARGAKSAEGEGRESRTLAGATSCKLSHGALQVGVLVLKCTASRVCGTDVDATILCRLVPECPVVSVKNRSGYIQLTHTCTNWRCRHSAFRKAKLSTEAGSTGRVESLLPAAASMATETHVHPLPRDAPARQLPRPKLTLACRHRLLDACSAYLIPSCCLMPA